MALDFRTAAVSNSWHWRG